MGLELMAIQLATYFFSLGVFSLGYALLKEEF